MNVLEQSLRKAVGSGCVLVDEPMSAHTTFHIGGPADIFVQPASIDGAVEVLRILRETGAPCYVLGRGSNVLVSDEGLRGVVVMLAANVSSVDFFENGRVRCEAGATNAKIASEACKRSLSGYEFAAGIPGTVGGAAIMNAGAYDGEFKQVARSVTCLAPDGSMETLAPEQAKWGYRSSAIADRGLVVLSVDLELQPGEQECIQSRMDELARRRLDKQPLDKPSAGSTFKRPEGHFAGKLIQDAGMQGYQVGGAQVSTKHAGFVVNVASATARDVAQVMADVQATVWERFGVMLEPEVRMWGFDPSWIEGLGLKAARLR